MWFRNKLTVTFDAWSSARNRLAECEARLAALRKDGPPDPVRTQELEAEARALRMARDALYQRAFEAARKDSPRAAPAAKTNRRSPTLSR